MKEPKPITGDGSPSRAESSFMSGKVRPTVSENHWPRELASFLEEGCSKGQVVIVGMGNPLKSDDYVGSLIAKDLTRKTGKGDRVDVVDVENSPENIPHAIWKNQPGLVVLIDALDAGLEPGSVILVDLDLTSHSFFTTHNVPIELILKAGSEVPRAVLLGVQPGTLDVGGPLSEEVQHARMAIVRELARILEKLRGDPDAR